MTICTMVLFLSISKQYYGRSWRRNWPYVMLQFPEFYLYKKIGFEKKKLYALFKNNSYRHYKGIQLPNAAAETCETVYFESKS